MPSAEHVRTASGTSEPSDTEPSDTERRDTGQMQPEHSLDELLDHLNRSARDGTAEDRKVSLGNVLDAVGRHSFAPLLMVAGLIMFAPGPADIPGVPVVIGLFVILVSAQLVMRREHVWVPRWMERRKLKPQTIEKMTGWLRRPAGWIDRVTKTRWTWLIDHAGVTTIAVACILIALATPVLEFVPFSANLAGAAITTFSLALLTRDGLLAALAMLFSFATAGIVIYQLTVG
jgi:hypothetical protein